MTPEETAKLLATCATYDNRKVGALDVVAWHRVVGDLPFRDSEQAVFAHYQESRERIMPADIRNRVKEARRERILDAGIPAPPPELGPDAYGPALQAAATAIADGRDPEAAMQAIARQHARPELEAQ